MFYAVPPNHRSIEYKWYDVGMLDYDPETKLWLVQKVNAYGRIVDALGQPIVNGGIREDGTRPCTPHTVFSWASAICKT